MKKFNTFLMTLQEELSLKQKVHVDNWEENTGKAKEVSSHIPFDSNEHHVIPLDSGDKVESEHKQDVEHHLLKHGYALHDYESGKALDKFGRQVNIGKVLPKTNADASLISKFHSDPARQLQKKSSDLHIVISRHPHDVAAMSTGQGWSSCVNIGDKNNNPTCNAHRVRDDIKYGTHTAYLTTKNDIDKLEHPVARLNLKPFTNKSGHTILRPDSRVYGEAPSHFHNQVRDWSHKNFPATHGEYKIDNVYHDDVDSGKTVYSNEYVKNNAKTLHIQHNSHLTEADHDVIVDKLEGSDLLSHIRNTNNLPRHTITKLLNKKDEDIDDAIVHTESKLHPEHVRELLDRNHGHHYGLPYHQLTKEHHEEIFNKLHNQIKENDGYSQSANRGIEGLVRHNRKHITDANVDKLLEHPSGYIDSIYALNQKGYNFKEHHIDKMVNHINEHEHGSNYVRFVAPKATKEHIDKLYDNKTEDSLSEISRHEFPNMTNEQFDKFTRAMPTPMKTMDFINYNDTGKTISPKLANDMYEKHGLDDSHRRILDALPESSHSKVVDDYINRHSKYYWNLDSLQYDSHKLFGNLKLSEPHIHKLLDVADKSENKDFTKEVQKGIAKHQNISDKTFDRVRKNNESELLFNKHLSKEHMDKILEKVENPIQIDH